MDISSGAELAMRMGSTQFGLWGTVKKPHEFYCGHYGELS